VRIAGWSSETAHGRGNAAKTKKAKQRPLLMKEKKRN
jgi:hypothetical protein